LAKPGKAALLLLLAGTGLYFLANVQRVAIPGALFNTLQSELGVSASWITGLGAAFMYVYALSQLGAGFFVERYGGRRVIIAGALLFCAGALLFPLARSLPLFYLSRVLAGCGASALYLSLVAETRRTVDENRFPLALSTVIFTGYGGGIAAGAPFVIGAQALGWRTLLLLLGAGGLLCWLLFATACGLDRARAEPGRANARFRLRPFLELLRRPNNRAICLCAGLHFGLYYVLQTVLGKKYLEDFLGFPPTKAGWVLSLMAILAACSGFVPVTLCRLTDGRIRLFIIGAGCMSAFVCGGLALLTGLGMRSPAVAALLCMLAVTASLSPIMIPLLYGTNAPERAGLAVSLFNFSLYFFVALLGNAAGLLLGCFEPEPSGTHLIYGQGAWTSIFTGLFLCALLVLRFALRVSEQDHPQRKATPA
jgi:predicted MFS family arabinose efflux permease